MCLFQKDYNEFENMLSLKKLNIEQLYNKYDFAKEELEKYFKHKEKELNDIYTTIEKSTTKTVKELTNEWFYQQS